VHSCFFAGKEKEAIAIFSENSWTHQKSNQDD
jgi:hypothetical protein